MTIQVALRGQGTQAIPQALPIQGVECATAAFVGVAHQGPFVSVAVESQLQFEAFFGASASLAGRDAPNYLWHAVKGFFDNGGRTVHVTRLRTVDPDDIEVEEHALAQALDALQANREAVLLCAPGVRLVQGHERLCEMLLQHCETQGWRFALLDPPPGVAPKQARALRERLRSGHGALYYPWIAVRSAFASEANDDTVLVPPSGHVAGLYADSDDQPGTHKVPANLPLAGALTLERPIDDGDYGALALLAVNCLRSPPSRGGVWVWGARTLGEDSEANFVAVRRYLLYLHKSLERGLEWVRYQPNGELLWDEIGRVVSDYLFREWRMGALMGASAQEAYFVRCDRSSLPYADLEAGRAVVQLGVALVKPAQFVHLRLALQPQV